MAIKISGTTIINDSRDIQNVGVGTITTLNSTGIEATAERTTWSQVGLGLTFTTGIGTNLNVTGVSTAIDTRFLSSAEKSTLIGVGTIATLSYNTGGGNIAICTSPTGNVSLNVIGIPTDSSFNNIAISFSVFINNTGTAYSFTTVNLNGFQSSIKWAGGSRDIAVGGGNTTNGIDIYNFTGINTVGSASTTANYIVLGSLNGGYR